jgi:hypothetical protein
MPMKESETGTLVRAKQRQKEVAKLGTYGKIIDVIKEFLNFILKHTETGTL